jgi:hypothetical protein
MVPLPSIGLGVKLGVRSRAPPALTLPRVDDRIGRHWLSLRTAVLASAPSGYSLSGRLQNGITAWSDNPLTVGIITNRVRLAATAAVVLSAVWSPGCGSTKGETPVSGAPPRVWTYPIHLGDSRARAHELLGNPTRTTEVLEEYPLSGVTLWFDPEGRLTKLNFVGAAGKVLYSGSSPDVIPSDLTIAFGLTAHSIDGDFTRVLGPPVGENQVRSANTAEVRRVWRKDDVLIDALFLAADRTEDGKTLPKGGLVWFEVSRGL